MRRLLSSLSPLLTDGNGRLKSPMTRPYTQIAAPRTFDALNRTSPGRAGRPALLPGGMPLCSAAALRATLQLKSCLDWLLAVLIVVPGAPAMLISMLLVKLTSRGPALYSQQRVGQFGRVFTIYKIRTMRHRCESKTGPRWATPGDPRVTTIGRVLRKLHIDELPQLWNVLRGEMSLLGPRPERPEIAVKLRTVIDGYDFRAAIKPGISGLAQIHLPPDTSLQSVRDKLVLDRRYIRNLTLWLDCKIFLFTALKFAGLGPRSDLSPAERSANG
jgi:lipopolysaccharide/colanic/teichoic acid biosynthesis glycosyltransferase